MQYSKNPTLLKLWSFLGGLAFYTPILVLYFLEYDVSLSMIVFAQVLYSIVIIFSELPTGIIADKIGHKNSVLIGCSLEVLAFVIFLCFPSTWGLLLGYIMLSLGDTFQSGSIEALLYEGVKASGSTKDYRKHFGQLLSFRTLAFAFGTAIAGIIYGAGGLSLLPLILFLSLFAKLFSGMIICFVDDPSSNRKSQVLSISETFKSSIKYIKDDKTLKNIVYVSILSLTGQYVLLSTYQPHFEFYDVSAYFIGFVLTIGGLANAISMRYIYLIERYWSLEKVVLYFNIMLAANYFLFSFVTSPWLLVILFIFLQAQYNIQSPIISDYVNDRVDSDIRATIISGMSLITSIANTLWKFILGLTLAGYSFPFMLQLQSVYLFLGALLSYRLLIRCGCIYKIEHKENES